MKSNNSIVFFILSVALFVNGALCCNPWILSCKYSSLPESKDLYPSVANGQIGLIIGQPYLHVNGLYSGHTSNSTHANVYNPIYIRLELEDHLVVLGRTFNLDLKNGFFYETIDSKDAVILRRIYAHRSHKNLAVFDLKIRRKTPGTTVSVGLLGNEAWFKDDLKLLNDSNFNDMRMVKVTPVVPETENVTSPIMTMIWSSAMPSKLVLNSTETTKSLSIFLTIDMNYADDTALSDFEELRQLGTDVLFVEHTEAWNKVWQKGFVEISGNCSLASEVYASFYYILSSLPDWKFDNDGWPFFGISPGSLAHSLTDNYNGHVFWDQDIWMLPGLLPFQPDLIGKIIMDTRVRHLDAAKNKALTRGYKGAMFPWELAYSGYETSFLWPYGAYEQHIVGDVAWLIYQYLETTGDFSIVCTTRLFETVLEIAKFWASRVQASSVDKMLHINEVMPPDEHHYPINDSVYTNVIASTSLRLPQLIYDRTRGLKVCDKLPLPERDWVSMADRLDILYDLDEDYHPEFRGYDLGEAVKQADAILIGYPFSWPMSSSTRRNDLMNYGSVTDDDGPAMTWSMFSVGYLEVGNKSAGDSMFSRNFDYIRGPFKIWTETAQGVGAVNFVTGMGGFIQNIVNGYLGLRVYADKMVINPQDLPFSTGFTARNVKYHGLVIDIITDTIEPSKVIIRSIHQSVTCFVGGPDGYSVQLSEGLTVFLLSREPVEFTCLKTD